MIWKDVFTICHLHLPHYKEEVGQTQFAGTGPGFQNSVHKWDIDHPNPLLIKLTCEQFCNFHFVWKNSKFLSSFELAEMPAFMDGVKQRMETEVFADVWPNTPTAFLGLNEKYQSHIYVQWINRTQRINRWLWYLEWRIYPFKHRSLTCHSNGGLQGEATARSTLCTKPFRK